MERRGGSDAIGARRRWCPPDSHAYNRDAAEKAWGELLVLFKSALG